MKMRKEHMHMHMHMHMHSECIEIERGSVTITYEGQIIYLVTLTRLD